MPPKRVQQSNTMNHDFNSNILINAITPFSGDPLELSFFFDSLNDLMTITGFSEPNVIQILRGKLTGEARRFFMQEPSFKNATTLQNIKKIFQNYFRVTKNPDQEWSSFKMKENETYVQLAHRLNIAAAETFPEMNEQHLQQIKLVKLKGVVPLLMQEKLAKKNFQNFEEAIEYCQKFQDVALSLNNISIVDTLKTTVANCVHQETNNIQPENIAQSSNNNAKHNYARRRGNSSHNANRSYRNNNQKFTNSNFRGKQNFRGNRIFKNNNRQNSGTQQCQFCGKVGHVLQTCFQFANFINARNPTQSIPPQNFPNFSFNMPPPFSFPMLPNFANQTPNTHSSTHTNTLNSQTDP